MSKNKLWQIPIEMHFWAFALSRSIKNGDRIIVGPNYLNDNCGGYRRSPYEGIEGLVEMGADGSFSIIGDHRSLIVPSEEVFNYQIVGNKTPFTHK